MTTATYNMHRQATALREAIAGDLKKLQGQNTDAIAALKDFDAVVVRLQGAEGRGGGPPGAGRQRPTFAALNGQFGSLATVVESADSEPTPAMQTAFDDYCRNVNVVVTGWNDMIAHSLPGINEKLATQKLSALPAAPVSVPPSCSTQPAK
jgi:hypothetical protein